MLRKLYLVPVLALFLLPAIAKAQFEAGNWALELSGSGANDKDWETGSASVNFNLGYFATKELEFGVRQGLVWADGGSAWNGSTFGVVDFHFDMDRWQPYLGANIGYAYGDAIEDAWIAGPEGGIKYFVNSTTYIDGFIAYEWNLNNGPDQGGYVYGIGVGFKW